MTPPPACRFQKAARQHGEAGFTLVEISVVIVIIALLVSSLLVGRDMIRSAAIRSVVSEIRNYQSAVDMFVDKYQSFPGDYNDAENKFGASKTGDGNGNGRIEWGTTGEGGTNEGIMAWQHLSLERIIGGTFEGETTVEAEVGVNVPLSTFQNNIGYYFDFDDTFGNFICLGADDIGNENDGNSVDSLTAYSIDKKLDDGYYDKGIVQAYNGCEDNGVYNLAQEGVPDCVLHIRVD